MLDILDTGLLVVITFCCILDLYLSHFKEKKRGRPAKRRPILTIVRSAFGGEQ